MHLSLLERFQSFQNMTSENYRNYHSVILLKYYPDNPVQLQLDLRAALNLDQQQEVECLIMRVTRDGFPAPVSSENNRPNWFYVFHNYEYHYFRNPVKISQINATVLDTLRVPENPRHSVKFYNWNDEGGALRVLAALVFYANNKERLLEIVSIQKSFTIKCISSLIYKFRNCNVQRLTDIPLQWWELQLMIAIKRCRGEIEDDIDRSDPTYFQKVPMLFMWRCIHLSIGHLRMESIHRLKNEDPNKDSRYNSTLCKSTTEFTVEDLLQQCTWEGARENEFLLLYSGYFARDYQRMEDSKQVKQLLKKHMGHSLDELISMTRHAVDCDGRTNNERRRLLIEKVTTGMEDMEKHIFSKRSNMNLTEWLQQEAELLLQDRDRRFPVPPNPEKTAFRIFEHTITNLVRNAPRDEVRELDAIVRMMQSLGIQLYHLWGFVREALKLTIDANDDLQRIHLMDWDEEFVAEKYAACERLYAE